MIKPTKHSTARCLRTAAAAALPMLALFPAVVGHAAETTWKGGSAVNPLVIKDSSNWTAGSPATGKEGLIDDSVAVPSTLYFGDSGTTIQVNQTLGAITIDSTTLTALNTNLSSPATSTSYSVALAGNTGNTVPLLSLGSHATQAVSISDTPNSVLNLQLGVGSAGINVTNAEATLTISAKILNKSGVTPNLVKTGAGMLVLGSTGNTFGGAGQTVQISGGTLSVDANGELGSTSNTVTLDGGTLRINPGASLTLARSVIVNSTGGGIETPTSSVTLSSALGGSGTLKKSGTAELVLNNAAGTFNGTINVSQGNLRMINPGSTAAGTTVQLTGTNSTLNLRNDADVTYNADVETATAPGQIFVANQSAGNSNHTITVGNIRLGSGTLNIGATANTGYTVQAPSATLNDNATISANTTSLTITGGISEAGGARSFTKAGANNLIVSGSSTYTGNTTVLGGSLILKGAGAWSPALTGAGTTDVQHGKLRLDYTGGTTPAADVWAAIVSGKITDSTAGFGIGVGYLDDTAGSSVTIAAAYLGDADLNGTVDSTDFAALAAHFNQSDASLGWAGGDFNYDGTVNTLDFNLLATNFGQVLPAEPVAGASAAPLGSVVPEPAALSLLGIAAIGVRRRRRAPLH